MALFFYKEKNKDIRAAAYLRLSIEDGDKAESNSIGNQRELIRDFAAERPGLHLIEEYADDGYTGTNFERPGFKRMMEDESDSMAVKIDVGDDNPAAAPCGVAGEVVCGIFASLFCVVFLSAGQCAIGNGDSFVPHASVARNGSTSNADRWICDFYDTAGGRRRGSTSGTGGSNASIGMVHIRCQTRIARLWNCLNKSNALIVERISIFSTMRVFHSAGM